MSTTVDAEALLNPTRLIRRAETLATPILVPALPGVYAWYFSSLPPEVPADGCHTWQGATLLYVGIAPTRPPANGKPPSQATLRSRILNHYRGNAEGSTLRLTLGCLLEPTLGTELRRVGAGTGRAFADREDRLSEWMNDHAFVCWLENTTPWTLGEVLIDAWSLPLNLKGNKKHPFHQRLSEVRRAAKKRALALPAFV